MLPLLLHVSTGAAVEWGIVMDCGSSGTRVHYYNWDDAGSITEVTDKGGESPLKVEPGISSFAGDEGAIAAYLQPLLAQAASWVPVALQPSTKMRLLATAGMRLLSADEQALLWAAVRSAASATAFDFEAADAATIGGNYEGLFGWLAVQELVGGATAVPPEGVGWLDLGGASTQIAFAPADGVVMEDAYYVSRRGNTTLVYATSYMRGGQDQAQLRKAQLLFDADVPSRACTGGLACPPLADPCHNSGFVANVTVCYGGASNARPGGANCTQRRFEGSGDYAACRALTDTLLHADYECVLPPCAVGGRYQPAPAAGQFVAGSAFFFTVVGDSIACIISIARSSQREEPLCGLMPC